MEKLERKKEVYWEVDEKGEIVGDPYCPRCFEVDKTRVHLTTVNEEFQTKQCPQCNFTIQLKKVD